MGWYEIFIYLTHVHYFTVEPVARKHQRWIGNPVVCGTAEQTITVTDGEFRVNEAACCSYAGGKRPHKGYDVGSGMRHDPKMSYKCYRFRIQTPYFLVLNCCILGRGCLWKRLSWTNTFPCRGSWWYHKQLSLYELLPVWKSCPTHWWVTPTSKIYPGIIEASCNYFTFWSHFIHPRARIPQLPIRYIDEFIYGCWVKPQVICLM